MDNTTVVVLILTLLATLTQTESDEVIASAATVQESERLAHIVNEFGYKLMKHMMKHNVNKNIVISPTGIAGLLAMTLLGSTGKTYDELANALGFSQDILANRNNHEQFGVLLNTLNDIEAASKNSPIDVNTTAASNSTSKDVPSTTANTTDKNIESIVNPNDLLTRTLYANGIVVDTKTRIRDIFRDYLERVYRGDALTTHFGDATNSQQLINEWVRNHTEGKIDNFLKEPLPVSTKVVLLSALYFSGQWARPFVPEYTAKMPFHGPSGDIITDLMLNLGDFNYTYKTQYGAHMISFPYNDSATTMYVLKPFFTKRMALPDLLESMNYTTIDELVNNMTQQACVVRFPRMELKTKVDLKDSLKELGLQSMFSPEDANFGLLVDSNLVVKKKEDVEILSRIYTGDDENTRLKEVVNNLPNPGVHVDSVLHDVKMTINEYGTVAVAATSGILARTSKTFYADTPFYMFIRNEKTKLVTFSAVIFDPTDS